MNLVRAKVDVTKLSIGTYWLLSVKEDGTMEGAPTTCPHPEKGWIRVVAPGVRYTRELNEARREFLPLIRDGKTDDDIDTLIRGTAIAKTVLAEWGNLKMGDKDLPYSVENALNLLTDRSWRNFLGLIEAIADSRAVLLDEEAKKAEGNSAAE
jgi:hypothetical protein